jgi:hypothetical protein
MLITIKKQRLLAPINYIRVATYFDLTSPHAGRLAKEDKRVAADVIVKC